MRHGGWGTWPGAQGGGVGGALGGSGVAGCSGFGWAGTVRPSGRPRSRSSCGTGGAGPCRALPRAGRAGRPRRGVRRRYGVGRRRAGRGRRAGGRRGGRAPSYCGGAGPLATTPPWARQGQPLCPDQPRPCTVFSDWSQPSRLCHHSFTRPLTRARTQEASPSPVYGAALLMRFGLYRPSRVQIPPPPPSHTPGAPLPPRPGLLSFPPAPHPSHPPQTAIPPAHPASPLSISSPAPPHVMLSTQRRPAPPAAKPRTRSSTDRASDYGSEGCRFESCRVHTGQAPAGFSGRGLRHVAPAATYGDGLTWPR